MDVQRHRSARARQIDVQVGGSVGGDGRDGVRPDRQGPKGEGACVIRRGALDDVVAGYRDRNAGSWVAVVGDGTSDEGGGRGGRGSRAGGKRGAHRANEKNNSTH